MNDQSYTALRDLESPYLEEEIQEPDSFSYEAGFSLRLPESPFLIDELTLDQTYEDEFEETERMGAEEEYVAYEGEDEEYADDELETIAEEVLVDEAWDTNDELDDFETYEQEVEHYFPEDDYELETIPDNPFADTDDEFDERYECTENELVEEDEDLLHDGIEREIEEQGILDEDLAWASEEDLIESYIPANRLQWNKASAEQLTFMKKVYEAHVARSSRKRTFRSSLPETQIATIENVLLRKDAALALKQLLQAAREEVRKLGKKVKISVASGYRSASKQFELWKKYFPNYYNRTKKARGQLSGGSHGDKAVAYLVNFIAKRIAAPGFSLHQDGLAVDLQPVENRRRFFNKTKAPHPEKWRQSWFWSWLIQHAASYGFYQNTKINEPWHWQYREDSGTEATEQDTSATAKFSWGNIVQKGKDIASDINQASTLIRAATALISKGETDERKITNAVFYAKHPDKQGQKLRRNDPLAKDWLHLRDTLVRPLLRHKNGTDANASSSLSPPTPSVTPSSSVKMKKGGWGGWKGKSSVSNLSIPSSMVQDAFDVAVAVASKVEGSFDKVNMYDRGILSWGIKQWTVHAGSLQKLLSYIQQQLQQREQSDRWDRLFPGLQVSDNTLMYQGQPYPTNNKKALMQLFRGTTDQAKYDENTLNRWITIFVTAGRDPIIQQLQFDHAKAELRALLRRNLGTTLTRLRRCRSSASWCKTVKGFRNFDADHYGTIGDYLGKNAKAIALFNGMHTQNHAWTYIYLKRVIDTMISRYGMSRTTAWPSDWRDALEEELERSFARSGVACWGSQATTTKKACRGRTSRTDKLLRALANY